MRVLFVIPGKATEVGSMVFARRQVEALRGLGVDCKVFFLTSRTSPLSMLREMKRFWQERRSFGPDILHAQYGTVTALFTSATRKTPLVITFRGSDLNPVPSQSKLRSVITRSLSQLAALRAKRVICVSQQLKERLAWGKKSAVVIPTGVDVSVFFPRSLEQTRAQLGWDLSEKVVLFNAGREPKVKRLDLAQAAVNEFRQEYGDARLEILNGNLSLEDVALRMNASDCLLMASDLEGSPTIVQEAMACNLPVVSVDVGDVKERLRRVSSSMIVSRDPKEIARALADIVSAGKRSDGSITAAEISQLNVARETLKVYQALLGPGA